MLDKNEEIVDEFQGIKFRWMLHCQHVKSRNYVNDRDMNATLRSEVRSFHLTFHKKYKNIVIENYFPHILKEVEFLKEEINTVKLFSLDPEELEESPWCAWRSISLNHPATFETVAMDSRLKDMILEDLGMFVTRKDYYRRVGKAWKRGYLLYGPPGTGKSSLIAAMANYLKFNVYDLQLDGLKFDWELRSALLGMGNKSIVVVEDIDCSIQFNNRDDDTSDDDVNANANTNTDTDADGGPPIRYHKNKKVTLSGILNFIDGLWSSCGDE